MLALLASAWAAPATDALLKARQGMASDAGLDGAVAALRSYEEACSADSTPDLGDSATRTLVGKVRGGVERRRELLATPAPADIAPLEKKKAKAEKKLAAVQKVDDGDDFLESKAEKKEREAKVAAAKEALAKAETALNDAKDAVAVRAPRNVLLHRFFGAKTATAQVLHTEPLVMMLDGWLGEAGTQALGMLPETLDRALHPTSAAGAEGAPAPVTLPTSASDLGSAGDYAGEGKPRLCLPLGEGAEGDGGAAAKRAFSAIAAAVSAAKAAKKAGDADADEATAALVEEPPEGWDTEEDGEWKGEFNSVHDRYTSRSNGCGCAAASPARARSHPPTCVAAHLATTPPPSPTLRPPSAHPIQLSVATAYLSHSSCRPDPRPSPTLTPAPPPPHPVSRRIRFSRRLDPASAGHSPRRWMRPLSPPMQSSSRPVRRRRSTRSTTPSVRWSASPSMRNRLAKRCAPRAPLQHRSRAESAAARPTPPVHPAPKNDCVTRCAGRAPACARRRYSEGSSRGPTRALLSRMTGTRRRTASGLPP